MGTPAERRAGRAHGRIPAMNGRLRTRWVNAAAQALAAAAFLGATASAQCPGVQLTQSTPVTVQCTSSGTPLTIQPQINFWNCVVSSSAQNWDLQFGSTSSTFVGSQAEVLVADGNAQSAISNSGVLSSTSGSGQSTVVHAGLTPVYQVPTPVLYAWKATDVARLFEVQINIPGQFDVQVTGPPGLKWAWFHSSVGLGWLSRASAAFGGDVNDPVLQNQTIPAGGTYHALVVYRDGGPGVAGNVVVSVKPFVPTCPSETLTQGIPVGLVCTAAPVDALYTPESGRWNAISLTSASNWDLHFGSVTSAEPIGRADLVVADGHAGGIPPVPCLAYAVASNALPAILQHAARTALPYGVLSAHPFGASDAVRLYEVTIPAAGLYDLKIDGPSGFSYAWYFPAPNAGWRSRAQANFQGILSPAVHSGVALPAGTHAVAVLSDGGVLGQNQQIEIGVAPNTPGCAPLNLPVPQGGTATAVCTSVPSTLKFPPFAGSWNVIGVTSQEAWSVSAGGATSALPAGATNFVVFDGASAANGGDLGIVTPQGATAPATVFHAPVGVGSLGGTSTFAWDAGEVARAWAIPVGAAGLFDLEVLGPPGLKWALFDPAPGSWRTRGQALQSGVAGGSAVSQIPLGAGSHVVVLFREGVPAQPGPVSISLRTYVPPCDPVALVQGVPQMLACTATETPLGIAPEAARWNGVVLTSLSSWDLSGPGSVASALPGVAAEILVADGGAGALDASAFLAVPLSSGGATVEHAARLELTAPGTRVVNWAPEEVAILLEITLPQTGQYDLTWSGAAAIHWSWFEPDGTVVWRSRANADHSGLCDGTTAVGVQLPAGRHAVVLARDGGMGPASVLTVAIQPYVAPCGLLPLAAAAPAHVECASTPTPFTIPSASGWRVLAARASAPWTLEMGGAVLPIAAGLASAMVAFGSPGEAASTGTLHPSVGGSVDVEFVTAAAISMGAAAPINWSPETISRALEVSIPSAGFYELQIPGSAGLRWRWLKTPAAAGWAPEQPSLAGHGAPSFSETHYFQPGIYALVLLSDAPVSAPGLSVLVRPAPPSVDLMAVGVSGPPEAVAGSLVTITHHAATVGIPFTGPYAISLRLSQNPILGDADDRTVMLSGLKTFGVKTSAFAVPADAKPGVYYWGLRVEPVPGELVLENNAMLGGSVLILAAPQAAQRLALSSAAPIVVVLPAGSAEIRTAVVSLLDRGPAGEVSQFSAEVVPSAAWLSASPGAGPLNASIRGQELAVTVAAGAAPDAVGRFHAAVRVTRVGAQNDIVEIPVELCLAEGAAIELTDREPPKLWLSEVSAGGGQIRFRNGGAAGTSLPWSASVVAPAPAWLQISPTAGVVAPGQETAIQWSVAGAPEGTHSATIRVQNSVDPRDARDVPIVVTVGMPEARAGDAVAVSLPVGDASDATTFDAIAGMRVPIRWICGDPSVGGELRVLDPSGKVILKATRSPMAGGKPPKPIVRTLLVKKDGIHRIVVEGASVPAGSGGSWILTDRILPKSALPSSKPSLGPKGNSGSIDVLFAALAGTELAAGVLPLTSGAGALGFRLGSSDQLEPPVVAPVIIPGAGGNTFVVSETLSDSGSYRLRLEGFSTKKDRVALTLSLAPPPKGSSVVDAH
ncbi:MAG: hypothetical protein JNJ88_13915 [Planctomycetes bacterium]|nr:hypothetical protein [Planctomycetota bacterium]